METNSAPIGFEMSQRGPDRKGLRSALLVSVISGD
jgi:hypothetical protein